MQQQFELEAEDDFKGKHKLGKDQEGFKKEYKTTGDALSGFNPFKYKK